MIQLKTINRYLRIRIIFQEKMSGAERIEGDYDKHSRRYGFIQTFLLFPYSLETMNSWW